MDEGLLMARIVVGVVMLGHGAQHLLGWFNGNGVRGFAGYLGSLGFRPGLLFAAVAGASEALSGAVLVTGLGTPVAAALLVATMINVAAGHTRSFWNHEGGWEYLLVLGGVGAAFGFTGPGAFSLDAWLGWDAAGAAWGLAALAAGVAGGLGARSLRVRSRAQHQVIPAT